jgi:hypothetical protein
LEAPRRSAKVVAMSILVWAMIGIALWHLAVLVPDRFLGGVVGAFLAATGGALLTGYLLPTPGVPDTNPPGALQVVWALPGSVGALVVSYIWGARRER